MGSFRLRLSEEFNIFFWFQSSICKFVLKLQYDEKTFLQLGKPYYFSEELWKFMNTDVDKVTVGAALFSQPCNNSWFVKIENFQIEDSTTENKLSKKTSMKEVKLVGKWNFERRDLCQI